MNTEQKQTKAPSDEPSERTLDSRLSRRAFLSTAGRLSAGALVLTVAGGAVPATTATADARLPESYSGSEVATRWFRLSLQLVKETPGFTPPVTSRAYGYLGITLYEAVVPGMSQYHSLAGQLNGLTSVSGARDRSLHWPLVANSAIASMTRHLFPTASPSGHAAINALERRLYQKYAFGVPRGIVRRSIMRGQMIASHVVTWAMADGGHEGYRTNFPETYIPPVGPGLWEPTPPAYQRALQPYWGGNRPFVLASGADVDPGPPSPFSTEPGSAFHSEAREVYDTVTTLTDEQRAIALFWADDPTQTATPPGHCISILTQLLESRKAPLSVAAEAYARVGVAVADAFISCWHAKYSYNLLRPVTYIAQHIDPAWQSQLPVTTPPFPEYSSGHSVQTSAFAQVMLDMFGDTAFTDHTHDARGLPPRSFSSWTAMAEEAAISRLYGGIHFRSAIERGIAQGRQIGERINRLGLRT